MWLDNKRVLITGGTGTIGKALLKRILGYNIAHVYIFSRDEQKQDAELYELRKNKRVSFIIGDIRDYERVHFAMRNIDVVFHTAAMKIVRICEDNPYEAFKTNVIGTENVARSAITNGVSKVIFTSSDKAANPTTTMGVGKLYGERLLSHANFSSGGNTTFTIVRFGNVLGSRGCVLDLFKNQIQHQNYITVTHPDMTRFICTIDQAINSLIESAEISIGGEIFIHKMPSIRIMDLAEVLIEHFAPIYSKDPKSIRIKITEKQPSEKLYEELVTQHEAERTVEFDEYYCILPCTQLSGAADFHLINRKILSEEISSRSNIHLNREELKNFLLKNELIE